MHPRRRTIAVIASEFLPESTPGERPGNGSPSAYSAANGRAGDDRKGGGGDIAGRATWAAAP